MIEIPDHPVYSKNVLEMLTVSNDFSVMIKKAGQIKMSELTDYLTKVSPLLYLKGALLPDIDVQDTDYNERFFTEEEWQATFNTLRGLFGNKDEFWYIDQEESEETQKGSLSDHLSDVFQDITDFLLLYQKNSLFAKENAVFELKRLFISNWGKKLMRAQTILHNLHYTPHNQENGFSIPDLF